MILPLTMPFMGSKKTADVGQSGDGVVSGEAAHGRLGAVVVDGVEQLVVALELVGDVQHGLDGAALGEDPARRSL